MQAPRATATVEGVRSSPRPLGLALRPGRLLLPAPLFLHGGGGLLDALVFLLDEALPWLLERLVSLALVGVIVVVATFFQALLSVALLSRALRRPAATRPALRPLLLGLCGGAFTAGLLALNLFAGVGDASLLDEAPIELGRIVPLLLFGAVSAVSVLALAIAWLVRVARGPRRVAGPVLLDHAGEWLGGTIVAACTFLAIVLGGFAAWVGAPGSFQGPSAPDLAPVYGLCLLLVLAGVAGGLAARGLVGWLGSRIERDGVA